MITQEKPKRKTRSKRSKTESELIQEIEAEKRIRDIDGKMTNQKHSDEDLQPVPMHTIVSVRKRDEFRRAAFINGHTISSALRIMVDKYVRDTKLNTEGGYY